MHNSITTGDNDAEILYTCVKLLVQDDAILKAIWGGIGVKISFFKLPKFDAIIILDLDSKSSTRQRKESITSINPLSRSKIITSCINGLDV